MEPSSWIQKTEEGTLLRVYVQPRAGRNEVVGVHEGSLKVRLTAPPVDGEANKECIKFLAKLLSVPKSHLRIIQGDKSRHKTLLVRGMTPEALQELLK